MTGVVLLLSVLALSTAGGLLLRARDGRLRVRDDQRDLRAVVRDLGAVPGERATLLQFSSAFCAPCRATRRTLSEVAELVPGVAHVEVDAEQHLDVVRRLGVLKTPTTLVLDAAGPRDGPGGRAAAQGRRPGRRSAGRYRDRHGAGEATRGGPVPRRQRPVSDLLTQADTASPRRPPVIDPRGPRFAAWLTTLVLAVVLLTGSGLLLAAQAVVFALGAAGRNPYALLWARFLRRTPPVELEDARPPRFAQLVGLVFAVVGTVALLAGATTVGLVATAFALAAAFLNAAFGLCLGCELYLLFKRTTNREGVPA